MLHWKRRWEEEESKRELGSTALAHFEEEEVDHKRSKAYCIDSVREKKQQWTERLTVCEHFHSNPCTTVGLRLQNEHIIN